MGVTSSGTGRLRVIGCDNYNDENVFIVAWKKTAYPEGTITTTVKCKTDAGETTVVLPEPVYDFSCAIEYPYMVYAYGNGTQGVGNVTERKVVVINIKTGATGEFSGEGLLMRTGDNPDMTYEGFERWKMLTAAGIIKKGGN